MSADPSSNGAVDEPARRTPVLGAYDVVVLGGGPSGVAAAVAAGRAGARTALVEGYGFLGGMGTAASVTNFCGLYTKRGESCERIVGGIATPILERLADAGALRRPHLVLGRTFAQAYDHVAYRYVLDDLCLEAGVDLHLHTHGVEARREGARLTALFVENRTGRFALTAGVFVDASGDASLCRWAGVPTDTAAELAWPTTMFRLGDVDDARALGEGKPQLPELTARAREEGWALPRRPGYVNPQPHAGEWRVNATHLGERGRAFDCSDAVQLTRAELLGRRQMRDYHRFLRERVPGFERSYLLDVGAQVGVRETRRVVGRFVLEEREVVTGATFEDSIGVSAWPVEEHREDGVDWTWIEGRGYHDVPRRVLETGLDNLLSVGRSASFSHRAQAALRVSGPCFVMGEAAGTLAALACRKGPSPRTDDVPYADLRAALEASGVRFG